MARKSQAVSSGCTILVVDDQDEVLQSVRGLLERAGHRVLTAASAAAAQDILGATEVQMMLVDQVMPITSGTELITAVRRSHPLLPIVLHTGYAGEQPPAELIGQLGIQGYHDKADGPEKLLLWVDAALKSQRSIAELREASAAADARLAEVSHELRAPLQRIGGYADLLADDAYGEIPDSAREPIQSLARSAQRLNELVSNCLTRAKLDAQALGVEPQRISVEELTRELQGFADTLLAGTPVRFAIDLRQAPAALHSDPQALRAILRNLLDHAAAHTERGSITLYVAREGSAVRIAVADSSPGIEAEQVARLFDAPADGEAGAGGAGLALALSQQLAGMLGADLMAHSRPGLGTVCSLLLHNATPDQSPGYFRHWPADTQNAVAQ